MKKIYLLLTFFLLSIFCFSQDRDCGIEIAARLISIEYTLESEDQYCPCYLLSFKRWGSQEFSYEYLDQSSNFNNFDISLDTLIEGSKYIITVGLVYGYAIDDYSEGVINIREFTREDENTWGNSW